MKLMLLQPTGLNSILYLFYEWNKKFVYKYIEIFIIYFQVTKFITHDKMELS